MAFYHYITDKHIHIHTKKILFFFLRKYPLVKHAKENSNRVILSLIAHMLELLTIENM